MLTPQEVSERGFTRTRFGGYNMEMVDQFLDQLTADYSTLFRENALLKNKMKGLTDKIEEYRASDESMRKALVAAQKVADEMVEKTQKKCDEMIANAEREAQARVEQLRQETAAEEYRLQVARSATDELKQELIERYTRELKLLDSLPDLTPVQRQQSEEFVAAAAADIEANIRQATRQEEQETKEAERARPAAAAPEAATRELPELSKRPQTTSNPDDETRRIDLDSAQSGRDYEVN